MSIDEATAVAEHDRVRYVRTHWAAVSTLLLLLLVAMPLGILTLQSSDAGTARIDNESVTREAP